MPSNFDGLKTVYVSLIEQDVSTSTEKLIGTVPVNLYVAAVAPTLRWVSLPQFVPFAVNAPITGQFAVTTSEAPLAASSPLTLEYTSDATNWTPVAATITAAGAGANAEETLYNFTLKYPLASEQAFRLHIKATDFAGNLVTSGISPNLIGRANLALAVAATDRTACAAGPVAESKFMPWFASAVLCQTATTLGQANSPYYAQLLLQNRGSAAVSFYQTMVINPGMGYQVVADGTVVQQGRFVGTDSNGNPVAPSAFSLSPTQVGLYDFAIQSSWLTAAKVTIVFDIESSNANSIANSCYAAGTYPSVVIQDKANGLVPISGALPCDSAMLISQ